MTFWKEDLNDLRIICEKLYDKKLSDEELYKKGIDILNLHIELVMPKSNRCYDDK